MPMGNFYRFVKTSIKCCASLQSVCKFWRNCFLIFYYNVPFHVNITLGAVSFAKLLKLQLWWLSFRCFKSLGIVLWHSLQCDDTVSWTFRKHIWHVVQLRGLYSQTWNNSQRQSRLNKTCVFAVSCWMPLCSVVFWRPVLNLIYHMNFIPSMCACVCWM